tara:strand:- start:1115 stop:3154 length:2040 start_codon:yes stop_codon:yes gene_type:complete
MLRAVAEIPEMFHGSMPSKWIRSHRREAKKSPIIRDREWRRFSDNVLHREDGPAIEFGKHKGYIDKVDVIDDRGLYYLEGREYSKEEWEQRVKQLYEDIGKPWYRKVKGNDDKNQPELIGHTQSAEDKEHVAHGSSFSEDPPPRPKATNLSAAPGVVEEVIEEIAQPAQLMNSNLLKKLGIGDTILLVSEGGVSVYGAEVLKAGVQYTIIKKTNNGFTVSPPIRDKESFSLETFAQFEKHIDQTKIHFEIHKKEGGVAQPAQRKEAKPLSDKTQQKFGKSAIDKYIPNAPADFESMILTALAANETANTAPEVVQWFKNLFALIAGMSGEGMGFDDMAKELFHSNRKALDVGNGGDAVLFGDSQMGGGIGRAFKEELKGKGYNICSECKMHVNGSSIRYWLKNLNLKYLLEQKKPNLIVISLGGNGGASGAAQLVSKIKEMAPNARIIWSGAPPAVKATRYSSQRPQRLAKTRERTNVQLQQALGNIFVDPADYMESYKSSPDGIHVPYKDAKIYVSGLLSGLGEPVRARIRPGGVVEAITMRLSGAKKNAAAVIEREMSNAGLSSPEIAAAIVNAYAESGLNPNAIGDGGNSVGLFQLHIRGAGHGMSVQARRDPAINTQTILKREVLARRGRKFRAAAANGASIGELAAIFSRDIERPKDKEGNMRKRRALAKKMFA